MFVGSMGVPGGGRNEVTDRFLRHMQIICLDSFEDNTLVKIFSTILDWHFGKGYVEEVARLTKVRNNSSLNCVDTFLLLLLVLRGCHN